MHDPTDDDEELNDDALADELEVDEEELTDTERIALKAIQAWAEIEGDDEVAEAQRELLVAVAQDALGIEDSDESDDSYADDNTDEEEDDDTEEVAVRAPRSAQLPQKAAYQGPENRWRRLLGLKPVPHTPTRTVAPVTPPQSPPRRKPPESSRTRTSHPPARPASKPQQPPTAMPPTPDTKATPVRSDEPRHQRRNDTGAAPSTAPSRQTSAPLREQQSRPTPSTDCQKPARHAGGSSRSEKPAGPVPSLKSQEPTVTKASTLAGIPRTAPASISPAMAPVRPVSVNRPASQEATNALPVAALPAPPAGTPSTGSDLRRWRLAHGLTQERAAGLLGIRQGTVSKAEARGDAQLGDALRNALASVLKR